MTCNLGVESCKQAAGKHRHNHPLAELTKADLQCPSCQFARWVLWFGGPLPTLLRCSQCDFTVNLSQAVAYAARNRAQHRSVTT